MSTDSVLIVIFASLIHAFWNLLVKKSSSPEMFICLSKITERLLFLDKGQGVTFLKLLMWPLSIA